MEKFKEYAVYLADKRVTEWSADKATALLEATAFLKSEVKERTVTISEPTSYDEALDFKSILAELKEEFPEFKEVNLSEDYHLLTLIHKLTPIVGEAIAQHYLSTAVEMYGNYAENPLFTERWDQVHDAMSRIRRITGVQW